MPAASTASHARFRHASRAAVPAAVRATRAIHATTLASPARAARATTTSVTAVWTAATAPVGTRLATGLLRWRGRDKQPDGLDGRAQLRRERCPQLRVQVSSNFLPEARAFRPRSAALRL